MYPLILVPLFVFLVQCNAQISGSFSVLSYNVAGLPELLSSSNPDANTPQISVRLGPYNVINVEEDFNSHAALYAGDDHPYRTPTSGGAGIGSGLNTLSDYEYFDLERVTWDKCNLNSGDCLTPKGFTFLRIRVSDGLWIDVYNLHTDAGAEDADKEARASNLQQVASFMTEWSVGMPVILMGDTNSRYSDAIDGVSLRNLASSEGLTDSWVKNILGGIPPATGTTALVCNFPFPAGTDQSTMVACEVVDKIFTRSNIAISLSTTSYTNEDDNFVNATGYPLSDHYPISSIVAWSLSSSIRLGDPVGGPHGTMFNDIPSILDGNAIPTVTSITVRSGDRVDGIIYTVLYPDGTTLTTSHGGTGGTAETMLLSSSEYIIQYTACQAQYNGDTRVFYISFLTSTSQTLTGGVTTDTCFTYTVPTDAGSGGEWGLVAFWGRQGDEMDRVGVIWGALY